MLPRLTRSVSRIADVAARRGALGVTRMRMLSTAANFDWQDPFDLASQLSAEERQVRETAREYARGKLLPRVVQAFRDETFDPNIMLEMGSLGLLGATIDPKYGGAGMGYVSYGLIAREIEAVDSGYRSAMSVQSSLVMGPIAEFGSEAQKQKYLPVRVRCRLRHLVGFWSR